MEDTFMQKYTIEMSPILLFLYKYLNYAALRLYRYEYGINFYCKTMIDANSTARRFNYFR